MSAFLEFLDEEKDYRLELLGQYIFWINGVLLSLSSVENE